MNDLIKELIELKTKLNELSEEWKNYKAGPSYHPEHNKGVEMGIRSCGEDLDNLLKKFGMKDE